MVDETYKCNLEDNRYANMTVIIHEGDNAEELMKNFQRKRAEMVRRRLESYNLTAAELEEVMCIVRKWHKKENA